MVILVVKAKEQTETLEVLVASKQEADHLAKEARLGGFERTKVDQRPGIAATKQTYLTIWKQPHGTVARIVDFLRNHPDVTYPK